MTEGTEAMRRETKGVLVWVPVRESWKSRERQTEVLCVLLSESANKVALKSSQHLPSILIFKGLPRWFCGKESTRQCRRCRKRGFSHWFGNIPWRRRRQPFPGFSPGKSQGQASLVGYSLGVAVSQTGLSTLTLIFKLLHVLLILVWLKSWFILNKKVAKDSYCISSFV